MLSFPTCVSQNNNWNKDTTNDRAPRIFGDYIYPFKNSDEAANIAIARYIFYFEESCLQLFHCWLSRRKIVAYKCFKNTGNDKGEQWPSVARVFVSRKSEFLR